MTFFPDTSFLCSLYREQVHSPEVDAYMEQLEGSLPVSTLLLFEFRQSCRLQAWLHGLDRNKGFHGKESKQMLADLDSDLRTGVLTVESVDWPRVHELAEILGAKHAADAGNRFADVLHVATALHLGADGFLTFDRRQKRLAEAEELETLLIP